MDLTHEDVEEIVALLDSSFYDELRLKTAKFELRLSRSGSGWTQETTTLSAPNVFDAPETKAAPMAAKASEDIEGQISVRAAMVGTFYRAPKPGAPPFVEIGAEVGQDTVIGIIETMKLMNSVSSGASGKIVAILVANGEIVEAGQVIMRLAEAEPE
jgi:acetyl-CoA carboxylase biotin carboxyl carrier protein